LHQFKKYYAEIKVDIAIIIFDNRKVFIKAMLLDIISNRGGFLNTIKSTLIELVAKNFVEISKKKRTIMPNRRITKKSNKTILNSGFSISSILISSTIKEITDKNEKKESKEEDLEETTEEDSDDKKKINVNGGYGNIKTYTGMSSYTNYADYGKIWDHVGTFRSQSMYEKPMDGFFSQSESKNTGVLVDNKVIEKAERHFKYFIPGEVVGDVGYVPPVGINVDSKEWEKYRLMSQMSIYRPLLALFRAIA